MHNNFHLKNHWRGEYDPAWPTDPAEKYVQELYTKNGYQIKRLKSNSKNVDVTRIVPLFLAKHVKYVLGIPDFIVIDRKNETFFFLEVKQLMTDLVSNK